MTASRPIEILLIEDSAADIRLTQEALKEGQVDSHLNVVRDGEQALSFLRQEGEYEGQSRPDLILMDLNLPRKDGREVLEEIKRDPELRRIPVVVMTTSQAEEDVLRAYDLNANCFISKPVDLDKFIDVVNSIQDFWLTVVRLPGS